VNVTLSGVRDDEGTVLPEVAIEYGELIGDVNGDGVVDQADVHQVKNARGQATNDANLRDDINDNRRIDPTDIEMTRAAVGTSLPL
jgi:hypothetical protein